MKGVKLIVLQICTSQFNYKSYTNSITGLFNKRLVYEKSASNQIKSSSLSDHEQP